MIAWNIGLIETEDGYAAYLVGAVEFWFDDCEWASEEAFTPEERYFHLPPPLRDAEWEVVLETVSAAARTFLSSPRGSSPSSPVPRGSW